MQSDFENTPNWESDYIYFRQASSEVAKLNAFFSFEKTAVAKKLVWHGKPSEFGHLFFELQSKGWIGLQHGGEINYSEFARVCMELFEFRPETTEQNLLARHGSVSRAPQHIGLACEARTNRSCQALRDGRVVIDARLVPVLDVNSERMVRTPVGRRWAERCVLGAHGRRHQAVRLP